jgi:hypothetical protein
MSHTQPGRRHRSCQPAPGQPCKDLQVIHQPYRPLTGLWVELTRRSHTTSCWCDHDLRQTQNGSIPRTKRIAGSAGVAVLGRAGEEPTETYPITFTR